jgi:hypothetical protein
MEKMILFGGWIAATIVMEILFAGFAAKRLKWKDRILTFIVRTCLPPKLFWL